MGQTILISDLHLHRDRPEATDCLLELLAGQAADADALYILGDLFEVWVGDDDPEPEYRRAAEGLATYTARGIPTYFMHGNRDFLVGADFARATGVQILSDPEVVDLYGTRTLLSHGDRYCVEDSAYQEFRAQVRDPAWQANFLAQPLEARMAYAEDARRKSMAANDGKSEAIMDVTLDAVIEDMRASGVNHLIHGHTHRPDIHHHLDRGEEFTRIVLGDWFEQGSVLRVYPGGYDLEIIDLKPSSG